MDATCDPRAGTCSIEASDEEPGRAFPAIIRVSPETATVYAYIDPLLRLESPSGPGPVLARRLLKLNAEMVACKLEWNEAAATIRLSTVMSTDSNFDRKAFRSQLLGLFATAERVAKILSE